MHTKVWDWKNAPEDLKRLSQNGGDEDWLVFVPVQIYDMWYYDPFWIEAMDSCRDPQKIRLVTPEYDGFVFIGAHA